MSTAVKAILATFATLIGIFVLAFVEVEYTHGAITVGLMICVVIAALYLMYLAVFDTCW